MWCSSWLPSPPASSKLSAPRSIKTAGGNAPYSVEQKLLYPLYVCLTHLKQRSSDNVSAPQVFSPKNMNLGLEEQRLPARVHWFSYTSSSLVLTCLCPCWEAASPSPCLSNECPCRQATDKQYEVWASVHACDGSGQGLVLQEM